MAVSSNSVVTTSIVVDFDAGDADGILKAEVDDRTDGLNQGDTSFVPGDTAGILLYKTTNVTLDSGSPVITGGSIAQVGSGTLEVEEDITFTNEKESDSTYPLISIQSYTWMGTDGGVLTKLSETKFAIPAKAIAVAKVTYTTSYIAYELTSPVTLSGLSSFSILVYFSGYVS